MKRKVRKTQKFVINMDEKEQTMAIAVLRKSTARLPILSQK